MVTTPAVTPVTIPPGVTVASKILLLLQVPPGVASVSAIVNPTHTVDGPMMAEGSESTVTTAVEAQPDGQLYDIVAVPKATPVTTPAGLIVATPVLLLLQVPPPGPNKESVDPTHSVPAPMTGPGEGFTVTVAVAAQPDPTV